MKLNKYTIGFLGITALAIITEVIFAFDANPNTKPWTVLITENIPSWITFTFFTGLFVWLVFHFKKWYSKRK